MAATRELASLNAVRTFAAAARHLSFKAAAVELHLTPSAVSHQIRALEGQLGVPLFIRDVRQVRLTEAGRLLYEGARVAFAELDRAMAAIVPAAAESEVLTVSVTPAFAARWLVPRLRRFHSEHPDVHLRVWTSTTVESFDTEAHVDVAVRYGKGRYPGLQRKKLLDERFIAVAHPAYGASLADLSRATLLQVSWRSAVFADIGWPAFLRAAGLAPHEAAVITGPSFDDESHVIVAALAQQGVALVSDALIQDELRLGSLVQIGDVSIPGHSYHLVARPGDLDTGKVRPFVAWITREARQLARRQTGRQSQPRKKRP